MATEPVRRCWASITLVMRNPDRVKKVETLRNAPGTPATWAWNTTMASSARPRRPSSAGW
jgi:hypothetical protein